MMSQYIGEYLSQHKTVSLEKIGTLDLSGNSDESIFKYDKRAETSPELLSYLSEKLGKSPLIVSQDFEYFLDQARQLINIRANSLVINGVGHIYANNNGVYAFSSESAEAMKEADKKTFEDVYTKSPLTASVNYAPQKINRKLLWRWIAAVIIIGGAVAYGAYYVHSDTSLFSDAHDSAAVKIDTSKQAAAVISPADTTKTQVAVPAAKFKGFRFIIQAFPDAESCSKRQEQLRSYGNVVDRDTFSANGKISYRLFIGDTAAMAADTARIKDSLRTYFGHSISVE